MTAKLSVIIPFYGVEDYIAECLDSVMAQTFTDFDCVLVDDGAKDGSAEIAQQFCDSDPRFRIYRQENQGLGPARNSGVRESDGEYLMFLDSDDIISPRCFEQLLTSLERTGSDFATANVWRWDVGVGVEVSRLHETAFRKRVERTSIFDYVGLVDDRTAWNKMFRRSWYAEHNWQFPPIKFEDYPVTLPMHLAANAVDVLPDPVYVWRERASGDSISQQSIKMGAVRDRVEAALMVCDAVQTQGSPEIQRRTYWHLLTVDILEVLTARLHAKPENIEEIDQLTKSLASRFDAKMLHQDEEASMMLAVYDAILANDFEFAMALCARRVGAPMKDVLPYAKKPSINRAKLVTSLAAGKGRKLLDLTPKRPPLFVGDEGSMPRILPDLNPTGRFLKATVVDQQQVTDGIRFSLRISLRNQISQRLTYTLRVGSKSWPAVVESSSGPLTVSATIPAAAIEEELVGDVPVLLEGTLGPLVWSGAIQPGAQPVPRPLVLQSGALGQFESLRMGVYKQLRPALVLRRIPVSAAAKSIRLDESGLHIETTEPLAIIKPYPDEPIVAAPIAGTVSWPLEAFTDPIDNPIDLTAVRPIRAAGQPLYFAGDLPRIQDGDREFSLIRMRNGSVALRYLDSRS